uniref:Innexin n=1 Tax=Dugesia japonica TaxID=6161 RepID=Q2L6N2_DUGJA|nr:innexin2 [Dugesia japonica]
MAKGEIRNTNLNNQRGANLENVFGSSGQGKSDGDFDCNFLWNINKLGKWGSRHLRSDDDMADRLNYKVSSLLMFGFISLIGLRQYVGKPIQCWIPQEFTRGWEEYSENYCWVASTYFAPISEKLPSKVDRQKRLIGYYQWAPIILAIQGFLFYMPYLIWKSCSYYSIYNLPKLISLTEENLDSEASKSIVFTARYIDLCIQRQRKLKKSSSSQCIKTACYKSFSWAKPKNCVISQHIHIGRLYGNFLISLYCFVKLLYIGNIIGQLYLMERIFGSSKSFFGIRILMDLIKGMEWHHSGNFPRVTFCDIETKKLGKNYLYTVQCVLPMNIFLEKIYLFLWFWHIALVIITSTSLFWWFIKLGTLGRRLKTIRKYLQFQNAIGDTDKSTTRKFVAKYLQIDGVFLVHMMALSDGELVAAGMVAELWNIYRHKGVEIYSTDKVIKNSLIQIPDCREEKWNQIMWNDDIV